MCGGHRQRCVCQPSDSSAGSPLACSSQAHGSKCSFWAQVSEAAQGALLVPVDLGWTGAWPQAGLASVLSLFF